MDEYGRNGVVTEGMQNLISTQNTAGVLTSVSKRDKKRHQIGTRLSKLETTFGNDRNEFYRIMLHNLQTSLAGIQQGTNEEYIERKQELEERRDYELTRLRLWEEYQVKRVETEYKREIAKAKENYDTMIKLLKEKFFDKLQKQVKQLKEDKLLLNLVNASSWSNQGGNDSTVSALTAAAASSSLNINDRRSLRKREFSSRFTSGEADDLSDSGFATSNGSGMLRNSGSGAGSAGYASSSSKRRRHYATRYSSNDEMSSGITSTGNGLLNSHSMKHMTSNGASSGNDSNLSDKDYDELNNIIMNNEDGGASSILARSSSRASGRANTRGSHKQFNGVQGLKVEELNDDLTLLRNAISVKRENR
ncbi:hypothetical protein RJF_2394 [Candidozyma auris]|uniref:Uncharacterized protein n=1 Tax=Candidozyma auris TaxID=498019 RepID=A0A8F2W271_CANAR|nr:hypothetical protein CA7LBN_003153 [[Candida] auris]GBL51695.1 hypothetical protein CAJCM15448_39690 [[Candida] auris]